MVCGSQDVEVNQSRYMKREESERREGVGVENLFRIMASTTVFVREEAFPPSITLIIIARPALEWKTKKADRTHDTLAPVDVCHSRVPTNQSPRQPQLSYLK